MQIRYLFRYNMHTILKIAKRDIVKYISKIQGIYSANDRSMSGLAVSNFFLIKLVYRKRNFPSFLSANEVLC